MKFKKSYITYILAIAMLSGCGADDNSIAKQAGGEVYSSASSTTATTTTTVENSTTTTTTVTKITEVSDIATESSTTTTEADTTSATTTTTTTPVTTTTTATTTTKDKTKNPGLPSGAKVEVKKDIEVYESLTVSKLVTSSNVKLKNGSDNVNTDKVGRNTATISYTYNGKDYKSDIEYTVYDTQKPLLINGGWNITLEKGDSFNLTEWVGYADNYDRNPKLTYTGDVNTGKAGTYPIKATVTDSSGNTTSWDIEVNVVNEISSGGGGGGGASSGMPFETIKKDYASANVSFGIDVSKWQGDIDFNKVKAAGCDFVIMRIGRYGTDYQKDVCFEQNLQGAKDAGLKVGVYLYTTANTRDEIISNAKWIADELDGEKLDFPVVFDWESFDNFQQYCISIHDLNSYYELFAKEMDKYGYDAMLYGSKNRFTSFWYESLSSNHPIWLAHYTSQTDYTGKYDMWQMSCTGRIDGIDGDVDIDILYNPDICK